MDASKASHPVVDEPGSAEPPAARLEPALTQALLALGTREYEALIAEVHRVSLDCGFTWERRDGGYDPLPLMLRPRIWNQTQATYVQGACLVVQGAIGRLLPLWLQEPSVREILPLTPYEEQRMRALSAHGGGGDPYLFARLDATIDLASPRWERSLAFLEPNVVGVGGTRYTALGERVWHEVVRPRLGSFPVLPPLDSRQLLLDFLLDRGKSLGILRPRIALVEDLRDPFGTNELRLIAEHFTQLGHPTHHVDVGALEYVGRQLHAAGHPVDLVYRFPELRELEELDEGARLEPLWRAFGENRVVSTLGGDFDHKSTFELFTSARFAPLFSDLELRTFRRHVLWTRLVSERRTECPEGSAVELVPFIRANREALVLKPNRSFGGNGVTIGPDCSAQAWEARLHEALENPGEWVVQAYRPLPSEPFPVRRDDRWDVEDLKMVSGFYATPRGVTSMGRVAPASVVNLSRQGASLVPQVMVAG